MTTNVAIKKPTGDSVLQDKMRGIAREIARDVYEIENILETYQITRSTFEAITRHPTFQKILRREQEEWRSADNTFRRTKLLSSIAYEEAIPEMFATLHDKSEPLAGRVKIFEVLGRYSGLGANTAGEGERADQIKIEINLGGDTKLNFEKALPPRVIDMEATDDNENN